MGDTPQLVLPMPSMSAAVRPASRIAATLASTAMEPGDRGESDFEYADRPAPITATWRCAGLRRLNGQLPSAERTRDEDSLVAEST
jgi:hypothetical protein